MVNQLNLILLLFLIFTQTLQVYLGQSPCPIQQQIGSVITSRITIGQEKAIIPLINQIDLQCYNYTLPFQFTKPPDIALALHDFEAKKTSHLYFSVKPFKSQSHAIVPLLIRTQWRYTQWIKISFSLLAEDRQDIEAGYNQLDTGVLGSCNVGKTNTFMLPFKQIKGSLGMKHYVFLHGFQISTQLYSESMKSPFQIHIIHSQAVENGISIVFSLTTNTQVHTIVVSYICWNQTDLDIVGGKYVLPEGTVSVIMHTPHNNIGRNYARIFGITGFIILHKNQDIFFNTQWDGNRFVFTLDVNTPFIKYLSYQYLFFIGSICSSCPKYPYVYHGKCFQYCPQGTSPSDQFICINCGEGYYWNGTVCEKFCGNGQILNYITNTCECPVEYFWNDVTCIHCKGGRIYDKQKRVCRCPDGTKWNGYGCATLQCYNGQVWNPFTYTCMCPIGSLKMGNQCVKKITCKHGQIVSENNTCKCPDGNHWNTSTTQCVPHGCIGGQFWNGTACICAQGQFFNEKLCVICINGQQWNAEQKKCQCQQNYIWNGNWCEYKPLCSGNRVFDKASEQCLCPQGQIWNGSECITRPQCYSGKKWNEDQLRCDCPSNFNWDGKNCILCINGQSWNETRKRCQCRQGTEWNGQFCVVIQNCYGGMIWVQSTWSCQCPAITVWNGSFCMANPCSGGKFWHSLKRECICLEDKVFVNGKCLPPQVACSNERIWNNTLYRCVCKENYYDNGFYCVEIPKCADGKTRNPQNGACQIVCPSGLIYIQRINDCVDPSCPQNKRWNGYQCADIDCPPNSYYNGTQCVCPDPQDLCKPWQYWDGDKCAFYQMACPQYTKWNGTYCIPQLSNCPVGFYGNGVSCKPFPQLCPPPSRWIYDRCLSGSKCPHSTYYLNGNCLPYMPCQDGKTWSENMINCICPKGTQWNGNRCLTCSSGKIWVPFEGCQCPTGSFENGLRCQEVNQFRCDLIPFSFWDGSQCMCHQGFDPVGLQCICQGVAVGNRCDRCAHRRNSEWRYGMCRCRQGYTQQGSQCLPHRIGNDSPEQCNPGTFFDSQLKRCLACPSGCLSCDSSFKCTSCNLDFNFNPTSQLCTEHCGDGKRYIDECDDGNVDDGDGCTSDCKIQKGYTCVGGSPNNVDNCIIYLPTFVTLKRTGQVRYPTKIVLNIKIDYLPQLLLQSSQCLNRCDNVFDIDIIDGDNRIVSISSQYLAGTAYTFSIQIQFGRSYIGKFRVRIKINRVIGQKFFRGIDYSTELLLDINPAILSKTSNQYIK